MSELSDLVDTHYRALNERNLDLALSMFSNDLEAFTPDGPISGVAEFRAFGELFYGAIPDAVITIDRMIDSGDTIVVEGTYGGTQTNEMVTPRMTIPPTGKSFTLPFAAFFRAENGKVVSHHNYWDNVSFLVQLGVIS